MKKKIMGILGILVPVIFINFLVFTLAWTNPTQTPPGGNPPFPLASGFTEQFKNAALGVGGIVEVLGIHLKPGVQTKPECNESTRGMMWLEKGGTGEASELVFCRKNESDEYAWGVAISTPPISWEVPVGAEGYDANGNLVIGLNDSGTLKDYAGMVVFKTAQDYGSVSTSGGTFEVLVVAGGGGGGNNGGGGGGAGGVRYFSEMEISSDGVAIVVGGGGSPGIVGVRGESGQNSVFGSFSSAGGGGGGSRDGTAEQGNGGSGGSGGGGGGFDATRSGGSGNSPSVSPSQGNNGGSNHGSGTNQVGGGGGGAGLIGVTSTVGQAGNGGIGVQYFGTYYGGGGGGGVTVNGNPGTGGLGGGGNGGRSDIPTQSGVPNTGGGGGGHWGGSGGSGIIIVRWGGYSHDYNPTL